MRIIYLAALLSWACCACTAGPDDQSDVLGQALLRTMNDAQQKLAICILRADWANASTMLVNETSLSRFLGCGRIFYIDEVSIVPHQNKVRCGDVFQARIAINSNDFKYEHSRKKLFVDGVELPIIARTYAEYVSAPLLEKEQTIMITAQIQNSLTGEFEVAFPPFEYIIRTD